MNLYCLIRRIPSKVCNFHLFLILFLFARIGSILNFPFKKSNNHLKQQRVLLLSFGGFRHDFIDNYNLVHMSRFRSESSRAACLNPQFTTQSYPNHWSIITGAYVENHGIIANKFYDPFYHEMFAHNKHDPKWWNESEPIWLTASKQGVKTFVHSWPGSEASLYEQDSYSRATFSESLNFMLKVNLTLKYFLQDRYKFVSLYHNQPDAIAHKYGLNSPEFNVTLQQLDENFGEMIDLFKQNGLYESNDFNIIVLSDHGITNIKKNVFINEYISEQDAVIWSFSRTLIHLKPIIELDLLLLKLSKIPDITVTLKEDMPDRLHYKNHYRIGEIIISAIEGVGFIFVGNDPIHFNGRKAHLSYEIKKKLMLAASDKATHGYDNVYPDMRGIFMGMGSMFKKNFQSEKCLENVDIYPLLCNILAIECEPRDGHFERSKIFLKYEHRLVSQANRQIIENRANNFRQMLSLENFIFCYFFVWLSILM
ncbi:unnamed protein product [Brachionus calyciflorus]|uniref:Uncharacterized protein n=1 Tax=Brachionus calyciflorus TaxID=104777 RepID=A0A813QJP6_9BILA|nr:unnamed protein product [Brachionus calyciflorus]